MRYVAADQIHLINKNGIEKTYEAIPDLWHIPMQAGLTVAVREQILEVWNMAHAMRDVLKGNGKAKLLEEG